MAYRFARQRRLIHLQQFGFQQFSVGRYFAASGEHHDVAHHDVALGNHPAAAVAYHLNGFFVVHLIKDAEFAVGLHLKDKCQSGGQQNGDEDAHGLEEHRASFAQTIVFVERNADGKNAGHEENHDEGVGKFAEEFLP